VYFNTPAAASPGRTLVYRRSFAALPSTVGVTVGVDTLPLLSASIANPVRPTITWSSERPLQAIGMYAQVEYGSLTWWSIVAPAVPGALTFPELPSDLQPESLTIHRFSVHAGAPTTAADYAAVRQGVHLLEIESNGLYTSSTTVRYRSL
jgi:hypothetical protein